MAEFGTPEWYKEQINENEKQKTILVHALCDVARQQFVDYFLVGDIAKKITDVLGTIEWQERCLKALLDKQENKENE